MSASGDSMVKSDVTASEPAERRFQVGRPSIAIAATLVFALGIAATAFRTIKQYQTPGPFDPSRQGMCDFHNGIYFPTRALLAGLSPYGSEYAATNPVARQIPFFLPSILALHAPFVVVPLHVGEVAYFVTSVVVLIAIAWLVASDSGKPVRLDLVAVVCAGLVFSRAGHITLFDGYFTLELVLATFLAIYWGKRRPWLAALALALVASKPTYILPLGFLMLARGNVKAIAIGAVISVVAAAAPMLWLAWNEGDGDVAGGITVLREQISEAQEIHRAQDDESPVHSWTRMDLLAVVAKWTGNDPKEAMHLIVMGLILILPMRTLHQRRKKGIDDGLTGLTGALIVTAMMVSLYRQSYDAMLLAAPLTGIIALQRPVWRDMGFWRRMTLAVLMMIPLFNYFSTRMVLGLIDASESQARFFTSINGVVLAIVLALLLLAGASSQESAKSV